ncbi:hypothetical protein NUU61_000960 [Penicillium alfredii]|uniref:Uncharacterized protein n=1 Tax=Penicillium alfredii TaxID=1506179 RepID=A0A9W9KRI2_9EURO|nr:uncharacterized protein NUU61_000960 [Penicillium alfredii]KAJ5115201.1 hypothetical protein NUU61_000960 [Penicillium alfredii]
MFPKTGSKVYELYTAGKISEAMKLQQMGGIVSTKYAVALYSAPAAGIENALQKPKPRTPYEEAGDGVKKTVKELMGAVAYVEKAI